jgi:hypothetical protein
MSTTVMVLTDGEKYAVMNDGDVKFIGNNCGDIRPLGRELSESQ